MECQWISPGLATRRGFEPGIETRSAAFFAANDARRVQGPRDDGFSAVRQTLKGTHRSGFCFQFQGGVGLAGKFGHQEPRHLRPQFPDHAVGELPGADSPNLFLREHAVHLI